MGLEYANLHVHTVVTPAVSRGAPAVLRGVPVAVCDVPVVCGDPVVVFGGTADERIS